jgi:DNA-binding PadR family transcriptional regulator
VTRVFGHGGLRLYLLKLLDDQPRYGYELIRLVEDHFMGMYTPSAGTIYPRLAAMEADGLIEHDEVDGRKVYRLTDAGREELEARKADLKDLQSRAAESARQLANEIRDEVRSSVRDFRQEIKSAMRDVRREERRVRDDWGDWGREFGKEFGDMGRDIGREFGDMGRDIGRAVRVERRERDRDHDRDRDRHRSDDRLAWRSLKSDLSSFAGDVIAAARHHNLDTAVVRAVRDILMDAREAVITALDSAAEVVDATVGGKRRETPDLTDTSTLEDDDVVDADVVEEEPES